MHPSDAHLKPEGLRVRGAHYHYEGLAYGGRRAVDSFDHVTGTWRAGASMRNQ